MADNETEINVSPAPEANSAPAVSPAAPAISNKIDLPTKHMSKGEVWYNRIVYQGINYWMNLGISILIADYFTHNINTTPALKSSWLPKWYQKGGRQTLDRGIDAIALNVEKMGVDIKKARKHTKTAVETLTMTGGGAVLLVPMKLMEDRKRRIVHWLNGKLGVKQTAPDGHQETADEIYIEKEQPKQNWATVIGRRIVATLAVVASGQLLEHVFLDKRVVKPGDPYTFANGRTITYDKHHLGGKERATDAIVGFANKGLAKLPKGDLLTAENRTTNRWLKITALDSIFTVITAVVMKVTNGAKKAKMPKEIGDDFDPPATPDLTSQQSAAPAKNFAESVGKKAPVQPAKREPKEASESFVSSLKNTDATSPARV